MANAAMSQISAHPLVWAQSKVQRPCALFHKTTVYTNMDGKTWKIWSHVVMLGREMVDTQGAVPNEIA